MKLQTKLEPLE